MKTSPHGIKLIEAREGIVLHVYKDSRGFPTVGCGHLVLPGDNLKVGDKITQEQCDAFLAHDLGKCEDAINAVVKVTLSQNQFDACASLAFNIGTGNVATGKGGFVGSTVVRKLNVKDYAGAAQAILLFNRPPEIRGRRMTEYKQFLTPDSTGA